MPRFLNPSAFALTLAVALTGIVVLPAVGSAQSCDTNNEFMEVVRQQAVAAGNTFAESGYEVTGMLCGALNEDEVEWFDTDMGSGDRIAYVAVCDQDCSDIDMALYVGDILIADDNLTDDVPVLEIGPAVSSANFRLKVSMYSCSVEPCFFGVAMFAKSSSEALRDPME